MFNFDSIAGLVTGVLDRLWPNPNEAERLKLEALRISLSSELAIHATNQEEAKHPSIWVAGWRPGVGWLGVVGLAYEFILCPLLSWASINFGILPPPSLETGGLITLLMGMLGLGAMRSYDKKQGTDTRGVNRR